MTESELNETNYRVERADVVINTSGVRVMSFWVRLLAEAIRSFLDRKAVLYLVLLRAGWPPFKGVNPRDLMCSISYVLIQELIVCGGNPQFVPHSYSEGSTISSLT